MKMPLYRVLPALGLVVVLSGCALTRDYVDLQYTPLPGVAKVAGAERVHVSVSTKDSRGKPEISRKINGYGMEMAAILANNDVAELVSYAISEELRNRGFNVSGGPVHVQIEMSKFYNRFQSGMWAGKAVSEVALTVTVKKPGGDVGYAKAIIGEHTRERVQMASGKNAKLSLEESLKKAVQKLMSDDMFFNALLKAGDTPVAATGSGSGGASSDD